MHYRVVKNTDMKLGTKLWGVLGAVVTLLLITLVLATGHNEKTTGLQDVDNAAFVNKMARIARWVELGQTNVARLTAILNSADPAVADLFKDQIAADLQKIREVQQALATASLEPESRALMEQIKQDETALWAVAQKVQTLRKAGDQAAVMALVQAGYGPVAARYSKSLDALLASQAKAYDGLKVGFVEQRKISTNFAQMMVLILVCILIVGTWRLINVIRQPLYEAIAVAKTIAGGDLCVSVNMSRGDEFGEMMRAISHMQDQLAHLVADVRRGTDNMTTASEEIATGNYDLANRTEQTASNLEKTASSMEELTATVKQSADSARQANQLAGSAAQVAQRGGAVVSQVVTTMEEINASSRKISDIISVIDGIAFQTNILALNAAVEAARAGEQGRGFAVVASEVRSLAGRSAQAAKEIKLLINTSVDKVQHGAALVAQAGATMTEIVSSVQRVTNIMGEITTATSEQAQGIAEVNTAVNELDQMTQQNAALVEQSAAAASSMKDQAHRLAGVVATFKLDDKAAIRSASSN